MAAPLRDAQFCRLVGLTEATRQIAQLPDVIRAQAVPAIARVTKAVAAAARNAAPVREPNLLPGYGGGALRKAISGRVSRKTLQGFIGLERGAVAVSGGASRQLKPSLHVARYYGKDGKLHSKTYRRVLSGLGRTQLRGIGGHLIQPTAYGHLIEFGTSRGVQARPFLRPAVAGQRGAFETAMREIAPDVVRALQQIGSQGQGASA